MPVDKNGNYTSPSKGKKGRQSLPRAPSTGKRAPSALGVSSSKNFWAFLETGLFLSDKKLPITRNLLLETLLELSQSPEPVSAVSCCRRQGKSTAAFAILAHTFFTKPNSHSMLISGGRDQASVIFSQKLGSHLRTLKAKGAPINVSQTGAANLENGASIEVIAASEFTGTGRTLDILLIDEARAVSEEVFEVVRIAAAEGKTLVVGTAGMPGSWWHRLIKKPVEGSERVVELDQIVRKELQQFRNRDKAAAAARGELAERIHEREWNNAWLSLDGIPFLQPAIIEAAMAKPILPYDPNLDVCTIGLDLSLTHDLTTVAVIAIRKDKSQRLIHHKIWDPKSFEDGRISLSLVEAEVMKLARKFSARDILIDIYQGQRIAESLRAAGLKTTTLPVTGALNQKLFGGLSEALNTGQLKLPNNDRLRSELYSLQVKESQSSWRIVDGNKRYHRDLSFSCALALLASNTHGWFSRELGYIPNRSRRAKAEASYCRIFTPDPVEAAEAKRSEQIKILEGEIRDLEKHHHRQSSN